MKCQRIILLTLGLLLLSSLGHGSDDFQYWSQYSFKLIDTKHIDGTLFSEARLYNDTHDTGLYYVSARVTYDYINHLQLGTNYTYMNYKSQPQSGDLGAWRFQHRAELEVNPYFFIGDWLKVKNRNRIEFRWIEGRGSYNTRLRHRWTLTHPLKDKGRFKSIYLSSEFIYNVAEHTYDENRTVPFGAAVKLNDQLTVKSYYMIQSKKGGNGWFSNQIIGTLLSYKF